MKLKKLKKIPAFIAFIIIFIFGYLCLQIIPPLLYNDNSGALDKVDCPQYINEFVDKNPQAIELKENYQPNENTDPIILDSPNGIPLYIQWDKRWAYTTYGDEIIGTAGCGPTCLSMVAVGLTGKTTYNPRYVAKYAIKNDFLEGSMTRWALMESGCNEFGLIASAVPLSKNEMFKQLEAGHPIIASLRPGDFTTTGHFIVITKTINDKFLVNDPNSKENSHKQWSYSQLAPQIKDMWAYNTI